MCGLEGEEKEEPELDEDEEKEEKRDDDDDTLLLLRLRLSLHLGTVSPLAAPAASALSPYLRETLHFVVDFAACFRTSAT